VLTILTIIKTKLQTIKCMAFTPAILELQLDPTHTPILVDSDGMIMETPTANVFFVKNNQLVTPDHPTILAGTIRDHLVQNQDSLGIQVTKRPITIDEATQFEEVFLTNATWGVGFVKEVQDHPNLASGSITDQVWQWYQETILTEIN